MEDRVKRLQALCDQLTVLQKQAEEICKVASEEIAQARRAGLHERRRQQKHVKRDRRKVR